MHPITTKTCSMKKLSLFLIMLIAVSYCSAQKIGSINKKDFEFSISSLNSGSQKSLRQSIFQFHFTGKEGLNSIYECRLVKAVLAENNADPNGTVIALETSNIRKLQFNNTEVFMPLALLNKPLKATISASGKVIKLEGVTEALTNAINAWKIKEDLKKQMMDNGANYPNSLIQLFFAALPDKKLNIGKNWIDPDQKLNYLVTGRKNDLITISSQYKQSGNLANNVPAGVTKRTYTYSSNTGLVQKANIVHQYKMANGYIINENNEFRLRTVLNKYPLDTAWLNMYMNLSLYSSAFVKGVGFDTVKLRNYFKLHDTLYYNDKYYRTNRLQFIQWTSSFETYSKALFETPNSFLSEIQSHHLLNKLYQMEKMSAAESYDVSRYFYKMHRFDEWLQNSFAQKFIDTKEPSADDKKYKILIDMYEQSSIEGLRQKTLAFNLWANARLSKNDPAYLIETANSLMKITGKTIDLANSNWYALMLYNMLLDVKRPGVAQTLLAKTMLNLETRIADSTKYNTARNKALLAYAYYSKYLFTKGVDSVNASQYLAKAALCSPSGTAVGNDHSASDRLFLRNAKESYRDTYIENLFDNRDTVLALHNFVKLLNSAPKNIIAMERSYTKYFPKRDFRSFFAKEVVSTWQLAPDFILKGIDDGQHKLGDYKNNWLLIDFWGTWCQPCREEMPQINAFNYKLTDEEHKGIKFLSVACQDNAEKVKSYLSFNKFNIPVAMADDTIEKQYQITGYPTKILVSPNGRMIQVPFGDNWEEVIEFFAKLYSVN